MSKRNRAWERRQTEMRRVAALECENWNLKHPVGTPVLLQKDAGEPVATKTRAAAYVSDSGYAMCFFEGVSGCYLLSRATAEEPDPITALDEPLVPPMAEIHHIMRKRADELESPNRH